MAAKPSATDIDSDSSDTPCLPARRGPDGDTMAATATSGCGWVYGRTCSRAVAHREPVGLPGDRLVAAEQGEDRLERLLHHPALVDRVDAHDVGVGRQRAGSGAEDDPAAGEVVEQHQPVGHQPRVVVGQRDDAGAELDVLGALGGGGDEDLGAADELVAAGVVLAEPGLVVAEAVEGDDPVEVVLEGQRRALPDGVERGEEDAEAQGPGCGHGSPCCVE